MSSRDSSTAAPTATSSVAEAAHADWTAERWSGEPIHQIVARHARDRPRSTAVCWIGEDGAEYTWTYQQLDRWSTAFARHLARSFTGDPEPRVGVLLPPGPARIGVMLAIWKAGGVFVPMEPEDPPHRLRMLASDAGVQTLVVDGEGVAPQVVAEVSAAAGLATEGVLDLSSLEVAKLLDRDEPAESSADAALPEETDPARLAYIFFTSGSTGRPKGVAIPHGGIACYCAAVRQTYPMGEADRALIMGSYCFDLFLQQALPKLTAGVGLVLSGAPPWAPEELLDRVIEHGITIAEVTTAYWQQWAQFLPLMETDGESAAGRSTNHPLRLVSTGGDAMSASAARRWHRTVLRGVPVANIYGPTEAVVSATQYPVRAETVEVDCAERTPIGKPWPLRKVLLLDERGLPVPPGEVGDIGLGTESAPGQHLARGYWCRPALTAERFRPDPESEIPGARIYLTGDLGSFRSGGLLDFHGRRDFQVKLRGFRIELQEIEAELMEHPAVGEAAVRVWSPESREGSGNRRESGELTRERLVAYVAPARGQVPLEEGLAETPAAEDSLLVTLRHHLLERLPGYMVPAVFVFLDELPQNSVGKLDRRALPDPSPEALHRSGAGQRPRDSAEELVAEIFRDVLSLDDVAVDENFFDLGGHSLLATRVMARVQSTFGVDMTLEELFQRPTVEGLARTATAARRGRTLPPLEPGPSDEGLRDDAPPLSYTQERFWLLAQIHRGTSQYCLPYALEARGELSTRALEVALERLLHRHRVLRAVFPARDGKPVQRIRPASPLRLPIVDLSRLAAGIEDRAEDRAEVEARALAAANARLPLDVEAGPLTRFAVLRLNRRCHVVLLNQHHIVADGWSLGVMIEEISAVYNARLRQQEPELRELPVQYEDYARWQRSWLDGEALESELAAWRQLLGEQVPRLQLPGMGGAQGSALEALERSVPQELEARLQRLGQTHGTTLFMTCLAALGAVLGRWGREQKVVVGTPVANRQRQEVEGLMGCFVNTLVMPVDLHGDPAVAELLRRVRRSTLTAYAHQDLPFERLVQAYNPDRGDLNPLFQVFFTVQSLELPQLRLSGLEVEPLGTGGAGGNARFDLCLVISQTEARTAAVLSHRSLPPAVAEGIFDDFFRVLEELATAADEKQAEDYLEELALSRLPLIDDEELERLHQAETAGAGSAEAKPAQSDQLAQPAQEADAAEKRRREAKRVADRRSKLAAKLDKLPPALRAKFEKRLQGAPDSPGSPDSPDSPDSPTVASGPRRSQEVSEEPSAEAGKAPTAVPREGEIPRRQTGDRAPLSFAQERLWFLDRLEPGSATYNIPLVVPFPKAPQVRPLLQALAAVTARHEVLRTTFLSPRDASSQAEGSGAADSGAAVQIIHPADAALPNLPLVDLSGLPAAGAQAADQALRQADALGAFDLQHGPLLRARLLLLPGGGAELLINLHHIVFDGWSSPILARELEALYLEHAGGPPARLPELPIQYGDYAAWQRRWLQGDRLEAQLGYWRQRLAEAPPVLELPTDHPRPPVQTYSGSQVRVELPASVGRGLAALWRRPGVTDFMILLAATYLFLFRLTRRRDLLVGTAIAGRNRSQLEALIGFFVNTLVLRTATDGSKSFQQLLDAVRETTLGAYEHQDLPFARLVEELQPERDPGYSPFFQVMLVVEEAAAQAGIETTWMLAKFDLTVVFEHHRAAADSDDGGAERWSLILDYNTDLFDATTVTRWAGGLSRLLSAALESPERSLGELPWLSRAQRHQLLAEWNDTGAGDGTALVPDLVVEQARRHPDGTALVFGDEAWSYGDLERWSRRWAQAMATLGVRGQVVVLSIPRTPLFMAAALAVLRAGGCYAFLDPSWPFQRGRTLVDDSDCPLVLTTTDLASRVPEGPVVWAVDEPVPSLSESSAESGDLPSIDPRDLAYVIYTSGSTGKPKGVAVTHGGLANLMAWVRDLHRLEPGERSSQIASLSFDVSVLETWKALTSGAEMHLVAEELRLDPVALSKWVEKQGIHSFFAPTPIAEQIFQLPASSLTSVRILTTGGERLDGWPQVGASYRTVDYYGPAEAAVVTSSRTVEPRGSGAVHNIGRPLPGLRAWVAAPDLRPMAPGTVGEIVVSGIGVSRGYVGQPGLTAERFVPDPTAPESGARLYRTGDLGRTMVDGRLRYEGRQDHQVKLRGLRIELGEIAAQLTAHPAVLQTEILLWGAAGLGEGDLRQLVAYVVAAETEDFAQAEDPQPLIAWLRERLPEYMVPTAWVFLEALPLTVNGKTDRRALPAPTAPKASAVEGWRSPEEELVAQVWEQVLGRPVVDAGSDFFTLGGHSLLATQVVGRLEQVLGCEMTLRRFFEAPTVRGLATAIQDLRAAGTASAARRPPLAPQPREGAGFEGPLSFAQSRLWFLDRLEAPDSPGRAAYNISLAQDLDETPSNQDLERALRWLIERHESLRTTFAERDGEPAQVVHPPPSPASGSGRPFRLPVVDLGRLGESPLGDRGEAEARRLEELAGTLPFDLERGPLLRGLVLRRRQGSPRRLLLTLHHIVSDGWSMGVLQREVQTACETLAAHGRLPKEGEISPLPVQYPDYALWQRSWLRDEELERQLSFWRDALEDAPVELELPRDRPRPPVQDTRGAAIERRLGGSSADLGGRLDAVGRRCGATAFMVVTAAVGALLARAAVQPEVVLGTPVAGRRHPALEDLIGFFVNTLVLRISPASARTFQRLVEQVRPHALDAYAHQDLPFEKLVDELGIERSLTRPPLFQAMVVFEDGGEESEDALQPAGGRVLAPPRPAAAKFDLSLSVERRGKSLTARAEYAIALFDPTTIHRLLGQLDRLLTAVLEKPEAELYDLLLLTPAQRHQLAVEWAQGEPSRQIEPGDSLHRRFFAQARRTPDAEAVVWKTETWTYDQLAAEVEDLAHRLKALGVHRGSRVAVSLERNPRLVVALLATLTAGAAYVPVDPSYPLERRRLMVADSGAVLVLLSGSPEDEKGENSYPIPALLMPETVGNKAPSKGGTHLLVPPEARASEGGTHLLTGPFLTGPGTGVSEGGTHLLDGPSQRGGTHLLDSSLGSLGVEAGEGDLAYLIYTSGSTGKPKGVAIEHGSALAMLDWAEGVFAAPELAGVLASTSISFDLSVFELFLPLTRGGTVVLVGDALELAGEETVAGEVEVTLINTVPSVMAELLRVGAVPASVRTVNLAGEPLPQPLVDQLFALGTVERVWNLYGPSEDTTYSTFAAMRAGEEGPVPIGRPVAGTRADVVGPDSPGESGDHLPLGSPGELYLAGAGVTRGYWGRPRFTAERFLPDPRAEEPGGRRYRTGDRVCWNRWGELEYLGRLDHQIKLRGFRIELGEVEAALTSLPGVEEAAVTVRGEGGGARLVAYFAGEGDEGELHGALAQRLPEHMVPASWVHLPALPRTSNRKIDRRALAAIPLASQETEPDTTHPPRDELEARLLEVWCRLLERDDLGVRSDFFASGGHSLLAVRLVAQAEQAFGQRLPLTSIFQHPTVESLAQRLRSSSGSDRSARESLVPLQIAEESSAPPLFLVHPVGGTVFCYQPLVRGLSDDLPVYGLQTPDDLLVEEGSGRLERMAERYLQEVHSVQPEGPYRLAGWSMGGSVAWEMARRLREAGEEVEFLALLDVGAPPTAESLRDPEEAELLRAFLTDLAGGTFPSVLEEVLAEPGEGEPSWLAPLLELARAESLLPPDAGEAEILRLWRIFQHNYRALAGYAPANLDIPVHLLTTETTAAQEPLERWSALATAGLQRHALPGDHYSLLREPVVGNLARQLRALLRAG
ncbi:MAG: amino acid adenylation domain-containing protein [Acidobacteriota bacterium]|nr:amino acid adenylation domain-containing protein [Acidobacteriota bacterium]